MKKILFLLLCVATSYGQIVPTGQEQDFDYGIKNTASQLDDNAAFITVQDATGVQGKSTSSVWAKKIYVDNADATKSFLSTGLIKNGLVTTNADPTKFNITAGIGIITNFDNPETPTSTIVSFPAFTGITPTYLTSGNITYVAITLVDGSPVVLMQSTPFDNVQRRNVIALGATIHSNLTTINLVNNISAPTNAGTNQLHDLMEAIGALNVSGNKYSANGANLSLNKSAGDIFKLGVNFANNWRDPNKLTIAAGTALTFRYRFSNSVEGTDVTVLDPSFYESGGVSVPVPVNRFSIQTVTLFQTGQTRIQPGQSTYATIAEAEAAIITRAYVVESNIAANGITRAYIILRHNATDLTNATTSKIIEAQKFGGVASGGVALTDSAIIAALGFTPENVANKQNSLAVDGTGVKYTTVDAVNSGLVLKENANQHKYLMGNFYKKIYLQKTGIASVKWLTFGDSYAQTIFPQIANAVKDVSGANISGAYFSGAYAGTTLNATTGTITTVPGYDAWVTGELASISGGATLTFGAGGSTVYATKLKIYYVIEPTGGTFKIQVNGVDSPSYTNVSASGTLGTLGIATITQARTLSDCKVVNLTGTVRIIGFGYEDSTVSGLMTINVSRGGIPLGGGASSVTGQAAALANFNQFVADTQPTIFSFEMKEDSSYYATALNTFFTGINTNLVNTDVILIGSTPMSVNDADQVIQNTQLESLSTTFGYKYYDTYKIFGSYANLSALGWQGDGTHVTTEANQYRGNLMMRALGLDSQFESTIPYIVKNNLVNTKKILVNTTDDGVNTVQVSGSLTATTLKKTGGTSSQFLKADGSIDSNSYTPISTSSTNYIVNNPPSIQTGSVWITGAVNTSNLLLNAGSLLTPISAFNSFLGGTTNSILLGSGSVSTSIKAFRDGGNFATQLSFNTTAGGSSALLEGLRITSNQNVLIATPTDNTSGAKLQVNGNITATNYTGSTTLTGTPTAPTATVGTNTTQIATTAFVLANSNPLISSLEFNNTNKTVWNNGLGNIDSNTSFGYFSFANNTSGISNSTFGLNAGRNNTEGGSNCYFGTGSGQASILGSGNSFFGTGSGNYTSLDADNTNPTGGTFLGFNTKSLNASGTNEIVIGYNSIGAGSNTVTLGNSSITSTRLRGSVLGGSFVKDSGTSSQYLMADGSVSVKPYKVYTALISQSSTSDPTVTVLENTLGGTVVWTRATTGNYDATLTGAFVNLKTSLLIQGGYSTSNATIGGRTSDNTCRIVSRSSVDGNAADSLLNEGTIEIRVYN